MTVVDVMRLLAQYNSAWNENLEKACEVKLLINIQNKTQITSKCLKFPKSNLLRNILIRSYN